MRILAIDTSTRTGSIALSQDEKLIASCSVQVDRGHAGYLLPSVHHLLKMIGWEISGIEAIACATGPGSFAALRVGISSVKGIAFATGAAVIGVNTLEAMALPYVFGKTRICTILDAKKNQVYAALFEGNDKGNLNRKSEDLVIDPKELSQLITERTLVLGDGAIRYRSYIEEKFKENALFLPESVCYHNAGAVAAIGLEGIRNGRQDDNLTPNYMRPPDAVAKRNPIERRPNGHCG